MPRLASPGFQSSRSAFSYAAPVSLVFPAQCVEEKTEEEEKK